MIAGYGRQEDTHLYEKGFVFCMDVVLDHGNDFHAQEVYELWTDWNRFGNYPLWVFEVLVKLLLSCAVDEHKSVKTWGYNLFGEVHGIWRQARWLVLDLLNIDEVVETLDEFRNECVNFLLFKLIFQILKILALDEVTDAFVEELLDWLLEL